MSGVGARAVLALIAAGVWVGACAAAESDAPARPQTPDVGVAPAGVAAMTFTSRDLVASGGVFSPSIMVDDAGGRFRLWYNGPGTDGRVDVVHRESPDGIVWGPPVTVHSGDEWGADVVRAGGVYRWLTYTISPRSGLFTAESADGLTWSALRRVQLPEGSPVVGDIVDLFFDPLRQRWGAFVKLFAESEEFGPNPQTASVRRLTGLMVSENLEDWTVPTRVFVPDEMDEGETEFYGAACCLVRDTRLFAFLRILRDDIDAGIGYTVLAWSDDGLTWARSRQPFLGRCPGSFDASTAWAYGVTEYDGTIYLSYSAYDTGHKVGERSVAIATLPSASLRGPDSVGPGC